MVPPPDAPELQQLTEGAVRLRVAAAGPGRGPGRRGEGVFYNPAMALARDVSLLVAAVLHEPGWRVLDGQAASGVRGLRLAAALPDVHVVLNDWNRGAEARLREHVALNDLGDRVDVTRRDLGALLWDQRFDLVDVDPFGSPAPFLDAASRSLRRGGLLAFAATDTAALNAVYPRVCRRRYLATPDDGDAHHEVALRILAGFAVRQAAKHDLALRPVLAHATDHYYRLHLAARPGARRADDALAAVVPAERCPRCGAQRFVPPEGAGDPLCDCGVAPVVFGPLWSGPLQDRGVVEAASEVAAEHVLADPAGVADLLELLAAEADAPPLLVDVHEAASRAGVSAPSRSRLEAALRDRGHVAAPTHVSPLGLRTDAPADVLAGILRELDDRVR